MSSPTVVCIMLANGRQAMVNRAVSSYLAQTYEPKCLLVLDTGDPLITTCDGADIYVDHSRGMHPETIGALRNRANAWAKSLDADIIAHWDSDDWSNPKRLTEQVALLQSIGAECVGYNDMLFWDTRWLDAETPTAPRNEAWMYRNPDPRYCLGTSMCYWREAWGRQPFDDVMTGEDERWRAKLKHVVGVSSVDDFVAVMDGRFAGVYEQSVEYDVPEPRMIASIHGGNTSKVAPERERAMFQPAPQWGAYCAERMKL